MADVLIVCVREDEPQAKALADMFEAAGFSIGGAPSSDGALRSSGAGVVVWSQASIRSRPFLDAAQRVINADKAVVASLIEPPPPSSIGDAPAFDLSHWNGDPNDPALDPLFFAVDRMVNAARASVGAPAAAPSYDAPPPPSARYSDPPPAARAPRPAPPPPPTRPAPAADPLGAEAEHWRAIRDSRNPADFMDYLARYGPEGSFAEVAELRLKQLTSSDQRAALAPTPATAPRPAPRPTQRLDPPAPRRPDPSPPRRTEPTRRADVSPPRRPPERSYDRPDLREPPKGEGGVLRAVVLIGLLGAVLAGGLYFSGGLNQGGAPAEQAETAPSPDLSAPSTTDYSNSNNGDFTDSAPAPTQTATRNEPTPEEVERERQRRREREAERARDSEVPPPVTNFASNTSPSGGPISLQPGSNQSSSSSPPSVVVPLGPPPAAPTTTNVAASTAAEQPQLRGTAGSVSWAQRPSARRIAELYPARALREGMGGRVQLDCTVQANLGVACSIASETPVGEGFGRAALSAAGSYRARPTLSDGSSAVGARTRIAVSFQAPQ